MIINVRGHPNLSFNHKRRRYHAKKRINFKCCFIIFKKLLNYLLFYLKANKTQKVPKVEYFCPLQWNQIMWTCKLIIHAVYPYLDMQPIYVIIRIINVSFRNVTYLDVNIRIIYVLLQLFKLTYNIIILTCNIHVAYINCIRT